MINVNLLPWRDQQRRRKIRYLLLLSFVHFAFAIATYFAIDHTINKDRRNFTENNRIWQQNNLLLSQNIERLAAHRQKLNDRRDDQTKLRLRKMRTESRLNLLPMIAAILPEALWFRKVSARQHKIIIEGHSLDYSSIVGLNDRLKTFKTLKQTEIVNVIHRNDAGLDLPSALTFLLEATWN